MSDETPEVFDEPTKAAISQAIEDATFDILIKKPVRTASFTITVPNDDGTTRVVRMKYQALDPTAYDKLLEAHPPTTKQRAEGAGYNLETFPPALISAVSLVPKLTEAQARELYTAPNWAPGETNELFARAGQVCNRGLDVPFNDGD